MDEPEYFFRVYLLNDSTLFTDVDCLCADVESGHLVCRDVRGIMAIFAPEKWSAVTRNRVGEPVI